MTWAVSTDRRRPGDMLDQGRGRPHGAPVAQLQISNSPARTTSSRNLTSIIRSHFGVSQRRGPGVCRRAAKAGASRVGCPWNTHRGRPKTAGPGGPETDKSTNSARVTRVPRVSAPSYPSSRMSPITANQTKPTNKPTSEKNAPWRGAAGSSPASSSRSPRIPSMKPAMKHPLPTTSSSGHSRSQFPLHARAHRSGRSAAAVGGVAGHAGRAGDARRAPAGRLVLRLIVVPRGRGGEPVRSAT